VKLCVTDAVGLTDEDTATVKVDNVAPTISASADTPKSENSSVTVFGTVTDPGWLDPLSGTISWGDGSAVQALSGTLENGRPNATLTFSNSHTYGDNGTWTVQVCAKDDDANPCTSFSVSIGNTAPTATIDLSGAVTVNGTPTVIAHAGQAVAFSGRSTDPGSDDLTLDWAWATGLRERRRPRMSTHRTRIPPKPEHPTARRPELAVAHVRRGLRLRDELHRD
jgi:PKD domain